MYNDTTLAAAFSVEMFATVSWLDTVHSAIYYCTALVRPFTLTGRWWCITTHWHYSLRWGCSPFTNPYAHAVWELPNQRRTRARFGRPQVDVFVFMYTVVDPKSVSNMLASESATEGCGM